MWVGCWRRLRRDVDGGGVRASEGSGTLSSLQRVEERVCDAGVIVGLHVGREWTVSTEGGDSMRAASRLAGRRKQALAIEVLVSASASSKKQSRGRAPG